jgi:nicotinamidase-related amidase
MYACGKYFKLPNILTTNFENGPNGPIVPELKEMFPNEPSIARPDNINAWDNEDFVNAVKKTGRKQLIITGVVTEVCVAFNCGSNGIVVQANVTSPKLTKHYERS